MKMKVNYNYFDTLLNITKSLPYCWKHANYSPVLIPLKGAKRCYRNVHRRSDVSNKNKP